MIIKNASTGKILASEAWLCRTLAERCKGLMFRKITPDEGCILVNPAEDLMMSSIHMMFVPQDLHVIWLDKEMKVVTIKKCRKANLLNWWRTYSPSHPAKYVIELRDAKDTIKGDNIQFINQ